MTFLSKELLGIVATLLTIAVFIPYICSILRGTTRPHAFSWIIWGSTTLTVFAAQLADNGGAGAWPVGISGIITLYVAFLAYRTQADNSITPTDWIFFTAALCAIPCWYITSSALPAVLLLTTIDILGYGPTIRKAIVKPFEEQALLYVLMSFRNLIAIAALENYSLTTVLFPAATTMANMAVIFLLLFRRKYVTSARLRR